MYCRIDISDILYQQRVIATHFQRQNFLRPAGKLLVQIVTGAGATGKKQAVDAIITGQCLTGIHFTLHQVDHPGRDTGFLPNFYRQLGHFRGQLRGFKYHGITR